MSFVHIGLAMVPVCVVGFSESTNAQQPTPNGNGEVLLGKIEVNFNATANSYINGPAWTDANSLSLTGYLSSGILTISNGIGGPYSFGSWGSGYSWGNLGVSVGQKSLEKWSPTAPLSCPLGKFMYVVTEAGSLGDSVRRLPWSEGKRASDAIAQIGGLSQLSGMKMWIARPSPRDRDKSSILTINWEGIARHGDNTTNYALLPGDRVVVREDATIARSNLISKHVSGVERLSGIVSLTASAIQGLRETPGGAAAVREIVRKGVFDDAPELKQAVEELVHISQVPSKKAAAKPPSTTP